MGLKIKYSNNIKAITRRMKNLPTYENRAVYSKLKTDSNEIMRDFRVGIMKNTFGLEPLKQATIDSKIKKGYRRADTPLYGKGGNDPRSYKNMLKLIKLKNGYKITPTERLHHSRKITLKYLFNIHEYGAVIKKGKSMIRIPPRPALNSAYTRWLHKKSDKDFIKKMKEAIIHNINTGKTYLINKIINDYNKRTKELEREE